MVKFKQISEVEVVETPSENDTLLLVSEGEVKQIPAVNFAAASGGGGGTEPIYLVTKTTGGYSNYYYTLEDGSPVPANLYDLFVAGTPIYIQLFDQYYGPMTDTWSVVVSGRKGSSCSDLFFYDHLKGSFGQFMC